MKTLALIQEKPGTGKTTAGVFLASAFMARGARVLLVDADPAGSALAWADLAGGFPWQIIGMATPQINQRLIARTSGGDWDVVIVDCPQLEDHKDITYPAMRFADHWIMPMAPAGIELQRALNVTQHMDIVELELQSKGLDLAHARWALLNRTNRRNPSKNGPDTKTRTILNGMGLTVFDAQVEHADDRYRQVFGVVPDAYATPFLQVATQLEAALP